MGDRILNGATAFSKTQTALIEMAKTSKATTAARGGDQGPPPLLAAFLDECTCCATSVVVFWRFVVRF